ncbi:hypothetical protein [Streptomyces sp. NPDC060065]|uniref:hypothetical protein n=1 Tax=Streptomyces sp. NPDC060065 TaxID=3347050 RepID=UPI0036C6556B
MTAATGWSATATAAFSGALLVSAVTGIPVGRVIDRRGPRAVMTTGSVLGVVALLATALAPNLIAFTAAWLLAGVGSHVQILSSRRCEGSSRARACGALFVWVVSDLRPELG